MQNLINLVKRANVERLTLLLLIINVVGFVIFILTVDIDATVIFVLAHYAVLFLNLCLLSTILAFLVLVSNSD
jgi:hypothetical protein